jgi:hypothetical protein
MIGGGGGPSYAMRSIQKKASGKLRGLQKEGAFLCCTEKRTKEKTLFDFLSSSRARLSPARPALEGKIRLVKRKKTEGGGAASYSLRENFRIGEAFGRGEAFISLAEAETIQSIRGFGEPKNKRTLFTFFIDR